jgi:hypothetical protein
MNPFTPNDLAGPLASGRRWQGEPSTLPEGLGTANRAGAFHPGAAFVTGRASRPRAQRARSTPKSVCQASGRSFNLSAHQQERREPNREKEQELPIVQIMSVSSVIPILRSIVCGLRSLSPSLILGSFLFLLPTLVGGAGLPVVFSEVTGAYTNTLSVELRAKAAGAVIRYTVDGTEPGANSPRYEKAISITESAQLRARAFDSKGGASEVVSQTYFLLAPDLWEFNSNLPLAIVGTFGHDIERDEKNTAFLHLAGGDGPGRVTLRGPASVSSPMLINQRGRASTRYPKRSYTIKLIDEADDFRNLSLLGLPRDADWILYAPYPDKTLMRDVLAYDLSNQLGRWAPRTRFIELFVLDHPGRLSREDYLGVYVLTERVKRDGSRVDVTRLEPGDNAEPNVTGGYIFKKDHSSRNMGGAIVQGYPPFEAASSSSKFGYPTGPGGFPGDPAGFQPPFKGRTSSSTSSSRSSSSSSTSKSSKPGIVTNVVGVPVLAKREVVSSSRTMMIDDEGNEMMVSDEEETSVGTSFKTTVLTNRFYYVDPEPDEITGVQRAWLMAHLEDTERSIASPDFKDPVRGYAAFIEADSFIDYHILVEMTKNVDGFRFSTFYHKDRGGKIKMGPLWDWNLSFGNCNGKQGFMPEYWLWPQLDDREYSWFRRLFEDPDFAQRYVDRWTALRQSSLSTSNVLGRVDEMAALLDESQKRNYERWPVMGITVNPNWFVADTYAGEVNWMKEWISKRLAWMDAQFVPAPKARRDEGGRVMLETVPGAGPVAREIYYTLDGTDPRAPGGAVASGAAKYSEPTAAPAGRPVCARVKMGSRWSGPCLLPETALARK